MSVPSALSSVWVLAGVTWRRLARGRAVWIALGIAALPCLYAMTMRGAVTDELYAFSILVLAILAPMFVGASIGEEIEDRTTTYLWSRPIPRWAVFAGKLALLVPLVAAVVCASWLVAAQLAWSRVPPLQSVLALAIGAIGVSLVATGIAALAPKHGMALTICYLLFFDLPLGIIPAALQEISITHQLRTLSGLWPRDGSLTAGALGTLGICAVWTAIAALRVRRLES